MEVWGERPNPRMSEWEVRTSRWWVWDVLSRNWAVMGPEEDVQLEDQVSTN